MQWAKPVSSIFLCSPLPYGTWRTTGCPFPDTVFPPLLMSALSSPFCCALQVVLARPNEWETYPCHCSLHLFMMVRRSSWGLIACWILAQTSSLVTWSLYEMCSILWYYLISLACILLWSSAVRAHDSQTYRKMDVPRECITWLSTGWGHPTLLPGKGHHRLSSGWGHRGANPLCSWTELIWNFDSIFYKVNSNKP